MIKKDLKKEEDFLYTYEELAKRLNRSISYLRTIKSLNREALELNKHYISVKIKKGSPHMIKWNKLGAIFLARRAKTPEAGIFLEEMGEMERHISKAEHNAIGIIANAIKGYTKFKKQFSVYQFKIDLYLPELRLAIECDERDHKAYDKFYEEFREKAIKDNLNCEFIRFNPSPPSNIGDVINKVFARILECKE